jgi:FkbM family methyltransferase
MRQQNTAFVEPSRLEPALVRLSLMLRVVIDCAYLFRGRLTTRKKIRIFVEYVRLTLKTILRLRATGAGTERVLGYSVRHFGIGSLQFLFREIFVRGDYFLEVTRDNPLVFDCGANIGLSTLYFKWLWPHCEIHAFEPDPDTFEVLKENVTRNRLANVRLHNIALADAPGRFAFFVPAGSSGSPLMSIDASRCGAGSRRIVVEGAVLSSYIGGREIDLLKMDIEGAEERVLREAAAAGALRNVREIAAEYHHNLEQGGSRFASFLQLLQDAGYHYQIDATWKGGGSAGVFQDILVRARRSTPRKSVPTSVRAGQDALDECCVPDSQPAGVRS